jgi:hypothetical protein
VLYNMERFVVGLLDVWRILIPCAWVHDVLHAQEVHKCTFDNVYLFFLSKDKMLFIGPIVYCPTFPINVSKMGWKTCHHD